MIPTVLHRRPSAIALLFAAAIVLPAAAMRAQLAHKGPVEAIALSKTLPSYDVSSIRQNSSGEQSWGMNLHEDTFTATNVPLKSIIEFAYDVKDDLIYGLSGPVTSVSFNIHAKVLPPDGGPPRRFTDQQLQAMVIPLLADRFHLQAHLETRELPVYELVVAKGGLKLKLDDSERGGSGWNINGETNLKVLSGQSDSLADLADQLSDEVGRKVIDKTGLAGHADITLKWSDEIAAQQGGPDVVSIYAALEDQLGLKLQPAKGPVDTLVIDHVEMPSQN